MIRLKVLTHPVFGTTIQAWRCRDAQHPSEYTLIRVRGDGNNPDFQIGPAWQIHLIDATTRQQQVMVREDFVEVPIQTGVILEKIETSVGTGPKGSIGMIVLHLYSIKDGHFTIPVFCTDDDNLIPATVAQKAPVTEVLH